MGNSCRSQIAEGWARHLGGFRLEVYSAGKKAVCVQPRALRVMREKGIDISSQWSKTMDKICFKDMDYIITLCGDGSLCPDVPATVKRLHWQVDDPVPVRGTDAEQMDAYRRTRDQMELRVRDFLRAL